MQVFPFTLTICEDCSSDVSEEVPRVGLEMNISDKGGGKGPEGNSDTQSHEHASISKRHCLCIITVQHLL